MYELVIDDREAKVIKHIPNITSNEFITITCARITTADYAILCNKKIIAIFERKTLNDYGASIKDGRTKNKEKLYEMRDKTGCRVYYIIEHRKSLMSVAPTEVFSGIPFKTIEASIGRLKEHDIEIIETRSTRDTLDTLINFIKEKSDRLVRVGGFDISHDERNMLFANPEYNIVEDIISVWCAIPQVAFITASRLAHHMTIHDIVSYVGLDLAGEVSTFLDRSISFNLAKTLKTLDTSREICVDMLACVHGVSKPMAEKLFAKYGALSELLASKELCDVYITDKKRLGEKLAERIKAVFTTIIQ